MSDRDRRKESDTKAEALYENPDIKDFIEKERRQDHLRLLNEVNEQGALWKKTVIICVLLNLTLLSFAMIGFFS